MTFRSTDFRVARITSTRDRRFWEFLDLIAVCFPAIEQMQPSSIRAALNRDSPNSDSRSPCHLLAYTNGTAKEPIAGLCMIEWRAECRCAYVVYLAIRRDLRSLGLGTRLYHSVSDYILATCPETVAIVLEVEHPQTALTATERETCERRIRFYRRLGFKFAEQLPYLQRSDWQTDKDYEAGESADLPMILGIQCLQDLPEEQAVSLLVKVFDKGIPPDTHTQSVTLR